MKSHPRISYDLDPAKIESGEELKFPIPFECERNHDLAAALDGQTQLTRFSFRPGTSNSGGHVIVPADALTDARKVTFYRNMPFQRESAFQPDSDFRASVVNGEFDRLVWLLQQMRMQLDGAIQKKPEEDSDMLTLPDISSRRNSLLGFDDKGQPVTQPMEGSAVQIAKDAARQITKMVEKSEKIAFAVDKTRAQAEATVEKLGWNDVVFINQDNTPFELNDLSSGKLYSCDCSAGDIKIILPSIDQLDLNGPWAVGVMKRDSSGHRVRLESQNDDQLHDTQSLVIGTRNSGVTLIPDMDPDPPLWSVMQFGPLAGNMTSVDFLANVNFTPGTSRDLTLPKEPGSKNNLLLSMDGVLVSHRHFTLEGNRLILNQPIQSSVKEIHAWIGSSLSLGVPADGSVTAEKLANGSITNIKLADGSITNKKLSHSFFTNKVGKKFTNSGYGPVISLDADGPSLVSHMLTRYTRIRYVNLIKLDHCYRFTLRLQQNKRGGHKIRFPDNTRWANGITKQIPTEPDSLCKLTMESWNKGLNWEVDWIGIYSD